VILGNLLHAEILEALASAGHGSKVLIADGNYPFSTKLGLNARLVRLNLSPGVVSCTDVLKALVATIPVETAEVMSPSKKGPVTMADDPEIWKDFSEILAQGGFKNGLKKVDRFDFYDIASDPDVCVTIATAEQRIFANILLTIGVRMPPPDKQK
jgi:L-fucose mutarotase